MNIRTIVSPWSRILFALTLALGFAPHAFSSEPPNVVVIMADDLGYGDLGCYGSDTIRTPRIDAMADDGIRLTGFYSSAAVCTPARASLLTGCYPARVGLPIVLWPNSMEQGRRDGMAVGLNPDEITIAELLGERGYRTALIGKWHLGDMPVFMPGNQGFDRFFGIPYSNDMIPPRFPPLPLIRDGEVIETNPDQDTLTRRFTEASITFIKENRAQPFFLFLSHPMPHRPCHASEPFTRQFSEQQMTGIKGENKASRDFLYPAAVEEIDWSTGAILDTLRELKIEERTIVIFLSDNGPATGSAGPLRGGKGMLYEGGFRVPCIVQWPGRFPGGRTLDDVVTIMDLLPTFTAAAGIPVPGDRIIDGRNRLPLFEGTGGHDEIPFFYFRHDQVAAVRRGNWKLRIDRGELYNLEEDIGETTNLAASHPDRMAKLQQEAEAFQHHIEATSRPAGLAPLPTSDGATSP